MRDEEQLDGLHVALARRVWAAAPAVRLHYHRGDDALVAELVQADVADEVVALDHLLVEFDGTDDAAMPTALYLTGVRAAPDARAVAMARDILGEEVWSTATALVASGSAQDDVPLGVEVAAELRRGWRGLAGRLRDHTTTGMIGVEFIPGRVHAVFTDADATVLDEEIVDLDDNDPASVVAAISRAAAELAERHPGSGAGSCPIGVHLGGPVHTASGMVEYYDKPLHEGDESWKGVPLGDMIRRATGRRALVFNDAWALASHELEYGLGRERAKVAVLVVRRGVGAKLVRHGEVVEDFPMEIGIFVATPDAGLAETPEVGSQSIEAESGVQAIIDAVVLATGQPCASIEAAAAVAVHSDLALGAFFRAGAGLARGVAAIQAVVNPDAWAVYGPSALVDGSRPAARGFLQGLGNAQNHLHYSGLWPAMILPRSTNGPLGGRAAAIAALRIDWRCTSTTHRNVHGA